MAVFLLDTSVIIDALNQRHDRPQLLADLLHKGHTLACCPINVAEVYAGLRPHEGPRTEELLQTLQYCPIIFPIARLAGLLKRDFSRKGIALAATDTTIAAVALYNHFTLITDNVKHYPMKELDFYPLPRRPRLVGFAASGNSGKREVVQSVQLRPVLPSLVCPLTR